MLQLQTSNQSPRTCHRGISGIVATSFWLELNAPSPNQPVHGERQSGLDGEQNDQCKQYCTEDPRCPLHVR
jgi:hypothetical protein